MTVLLWKDIDKMLPEVNKKCICMTSNGNYFISEMYIPKSGGNKQWKGIRSKTVESIVKWSYLDVKNYEKV
jgi:hypothetical protein